MLTRRQIYILLIVISAGLMLGRIGAVNRTDTLLLQQSRFSEVNRTFNERERELERQFHEGNVSEEAFEEGVADLANRRRQALDNERRELPFFSANDRSRWNTIRALVEPDMRVQRTITFPDGTQRPETVWFANNIVQNVSGWDTIDMVKHGTLNREFTKEGMRVLQIQWTTMRRNGDEEVKIVWSARDEPQMIGDQERVYNKNGNRIEMGKVENTPHVFAVLEEQRAKILMLDRETNELRPLSDRENSQLLRLADGERRIETIWYARHDYNVPDQPNVGYLYSSKPPLLPTLMAIPYAAIYWASEGKITLANNPHLIARVTLIIFNIIPLIIGWFLLARLVERFGTSNWGRVFSVAFICFGTFLSTFAITLNNHIPGMASVAIAFYCVVRIVYDNDARWWHFALAGFFGAFAVACELPALLFCCLIGLWIFCHQWKRTLLLFAPAALLVAGAYFGTNYIAHQTFIPAYAKKYAEDSWYIYEYERGGRVLQSYWQNPQGLDQGEECISTYVFHSTIGHHGLFSLTPVWTLSFIGLIFWLFDRRYRSMALIILFTSIVVFAFYMQQPVHERNYGGNTCALRWMFWFAPLWSVALVAAADQFGRNVFFQWIALLCLAVSVMSAAYPVWNPWTMPWTYNLLQYFG